MSGRQSKIEKEREKVTQDRAQVVLTGMLKDEDNKYCVDCDNKGPRWASWNLGIFLCIRCAGIHRNLGVHISKVKSVNLDSWTPQQVSSMQQMGNSKARSVYEASLPEDFRRPQTDSAVEAFVRQKYEKKKFLQANWEPSKPPEIPVGWDGGDASIASKVKADLGKKVTAPPRSPIAPVTPRPVQKTETPKPVTPKPVTAKPVIAATTLSTSASADLLGLMTSPSIVSSTSISSSASSDLLGLQAEFGDFASASESNFQDNNLNLASSNSDLFSNPAAKQPADSGKLSTDSIMALFGPKTTPTQMFHTTPTQQPFPPPQQSQTPFMGSQLGNMNMFTNSTNYSALPQQQAPGAPANNPFIADTGILGNQLGGLNLGHGQTSLWQ